MKSLDRLRKQLERILSGFQEPDDAPEEFGFERFGFDPKLQPEGWIWESDADGRFTWCSPEVERYLDFTPDDLIGKELSGLAADASTAEEIRQLTETGEDIRDFKMEAPGREGQIFSLLTNALCRTGPEGERLGYRGVSLVLAIEKPQVEEPVLEREIEVASPGFAETITDIPVSIPSVWGSVPGYVADGISIRPLGDDEPAPDPTIAIDQDRLIVPIRSRDRLLGVIELDENESGNPWGGDDLALAQSVAQDLALALQDARTHWLTQQALEEMREVDRLKSQFLANMSHELRTPLNSIIGFSSVILKGIDGPINDTQEQDLSAIHNAGLHLLGLINDILDVSRIEAGKMDLSITEVNLEEIILSVMTTASGLVGDKPIELKSDIQDDLPTIQADSIRLRQILLNLISNATKFTQRGHIGISARILEDADPRQVLIAVFDTGPGIDPIDQEKLFEPFSQVDDSPTRRAGGSGLGLSICRHLVELHGGRIWVESVIGEGSTFYFTIPIEQPVAGSETV